MRLRKTICGVLLCALALMPGARGDEQEARARKERELQRITSEYEDFRDELESSALDDSMKASDRLKRIVERLEAELVDFDAFKEEREAAEKRLTEVRSKLGTLQGQLAALESSLTLTQTEVRAVELQILKRVAEVKYLLEEAERLKFEKSNQQKAVIEFFALLQYENEEFGVNDETRNVLRLLLSDGSFAENLREGEQLAAMEAIGRKVFHGLEAAEKELAAVTRLINDENQKLNDLHDKKSLEEKRLAEQLTTKKLLVEHVRENEETFQKLLDESKAQMEESARAIGSLIENKELLEEKMALLEAKQQEIRREAPLIRDPVKSDQPNFDLGEEFLRDDAKKSFFSWPVPPLKGISAYFRDPSYREVFNVDHQAIDIPTPQGTEIKAPALGYVYKVTDNGMGYSSLIIAHRDNIMSVYGHVSKFLVKEGDLVKPGTPIALSGGAPGTKGAGWMTTGPHLHFEVFLDGKRVDPMPYLPAEELPGKKN